MKYAVIAILSGLLGFLLCHQCSDPEPDIVEEVRVDTVYGSFDFIEINPVQEVHEFDTTIYREEGDTLIADTAAILSQVDTAAILSDYFVRRTYQESVEDTNVAIDVHTEVHKNKLDSFSIDYEVAERTKIEKKTRQNFTVGLSAAPEHFEPNVGYQYGDHAFGLGYEIESSKPIIRYQYALPF